jgi:hypothetical protein
VILRPLQKEELVCLLIGVGRGVWSRATGEWEDKSGETAASSEEGFVCIYGDCST